MYQKIFSNNCKWVSKNYAHETERFFSENISTRSCKSKIIYDYVISNINRLEFGTHK